METESTPPAAAQPRRWRLRFSLRTLVFVVPVLALFLSWIGNEAGRYRRDHAAADALWSKTGALVDSSGGTWNGPPVRPGELIRGRLYSPYSRLDIGFHPYAALEKEDWEAAGKLLDLHSLQIYQYDGPSDGKTFGHLPRLTQLQLHESRLTENDLRQIGELEHLLWLTCFNAFPISVAANGPRPFNDPGKLPSLTLAPNSWQQLETLQLGGVRLSPETLQTIAGLSRLRYLSLETCDFDPRALDALGKLPELEALQVAPTGIWANLSWPGEQPDNIDERTLGSWGRLPKLRTLDIREVQIQDFGGAGENLTDRWSQLFELRLTDADLSPAAMREIAAMPALKVLIFTGELPDPQAIAELGRSQSLYHLCFHGEGVDLAAIDQIAKIPTLEALELTGKQIDDDVLRRVAQIKQLTTLGLYDTQATDAGFDAWKNHPSLQVVHIRRSKSFTYRSLEILAKIPTFSFQESVIDVPGFNPLIDEELQAVEHRGGDALQHLQRKGLVPADQPPQ